ncbi:MAG: diguanylate cyclase, partial [Lachnospiraceae bacterium]|nr:diguanylate cyclase [Lachnospiraceae bacterium]
AKHPIWMDTYTNENIGKEMISYVIPVYYKDRTIGILGMDIDVQYLRDEVSEVELYNTGYAFLVQVNDDILYHPKYPSGVRRKELSEDFVKLIAGIESEENLTKVVDATFKGERVRLVADRLANDMILCIVVPESEFTRELDEIVTDAAKLALPVAIIGILMIIIMLYRIVNPLRKLARISSNIEQGNFDSEFDFRMDRNDEVGVLARSFDSMSNSMKAHFEYMNNVAYLDELTGLGNRNAYMEKEDEFENQVIDGKASFTVVVMDVNNLKWVNDYSGHEMGDRMLMRIASLIRDEFGKDRCYRIGGDEFVALYPGIVEDISDKIAEFQTSVMEKSEHDYDEFKFHYNVACGYAIFDQEIDSSFTDVFRRADYMMYDDKERIKASNPVEY